LGSHMKRKKEVTSGGGNKSKRGEKNKKENAEGETSNGEKKRPRLGKNEERPIIVGNWSGETAEEKKGLSKKGKTKTFPRKRVRKGKITEENGTMEQKFGGTIPYPKKVGALPKKEKIKKETMKGPGREKVPTLGKGAKGGKKADRWGLKGNPQERRHWSHLERNSGRGGERPRPTKGPKALLTKSWPKKKRQV